MREEIIAEIKTSIIKEMKDSTAKEIKTDVRKEFDQKIEDSTREFRNHAKEISDGFNLDFETLREKLCDEARELRGLKEIFKQLQYYYRADNALRLANQYQQYSQKSNIKLLRWEEKQN
jgi:hypothetical protein